MNIYIEKNKGDFIYAEWVEEELKAMENKFKELESKGYERQDIDMDFKNQYYIYKNKDGHEVIVTLLCC